MVLSAFTELRLGGSGGKLYTGSLATLLAIHLPRRHSSIAPPPLPHVQRLDARTLNQLTRFRLAR